MGTSLHILYSVLIDIDEVYTFRGDTNCSTELNNFKILLRNSSDLRKKFSQTFDDSFLVYLIEHMRVRTLFYRVSPASIHFSS